MKSGIVASLMAMISIKRSGSKFKGTILYTAVGDEEFHSQFGTKYLIENGLKADYAICCEPTNLDLELGNRGLVMIDVMIKGRSCHAGRPNLGVNAIHRAARIVNALDEMVFNQLQNEAFELPHGNISVVAINGGEKINVIPDRCSLYIDRRLMPGEKGSNAVGEISDIVKKVTGIKPDIGQDLGSEIVMFPEFWHEPFWISETAPIAVSAYKNIMRILGKAPAIRGKAAGTDASHLVALANIPTIILGPGDFKLSHTSNEKVKLSDVLTAAKIYEAIVLDLLNE